MSLYKHTNETILSFFLSLRLCNKFLVEHLRSLILVLERHDSMLILILQSPPKQMKSGRESNCSKHAEGAYRPSRSGNLHEVPRLSHAMSHANP